MTAHPIATTKEINRIKQRPLTHQTQVGSWLEELDFYEKEIAFYCQMLRIGIRNGRGTTQPLFYELLDAFAAMRDNTVPGIRKLAIAFMQGETQPDFILAFHTNMETLKQEMRNMKTKSFPLLPEIQQITIW